MEMCIENRKDRIIMNRERQQDGNVHWKKKNTEEREMMARKLDRNVHWKMKK